MNARRFDLSFTVLLLLGSLAYLARMLTYPGGAGRVPSVVSAVAVGALILQLVLITLRHDAAVERETLGEPVLIPGAAVEEPEEHGSPVVEEQDSYETLVALRGERRVKFISIAAFTIAFYFGVLLVGFVITSTVLVSGILVLCRERWPIVLAGGATGLVVSYGMMVWLLDLPAVSGVLFP